MSQKFSNQATVSIKGESGCPSSGVEEAVKTLDVLLRGQMPAEKELKHVQKLLLSIYDGGDDHEQLSKRLQDYDSETRDALLQIMSDSNVKLTTPELPMRTGNTPRQGVSRHLRSLLLKATTSWDFDPFELDRISNGHPLSNLFIWLIEEANLVDTLGLNPIKMRKFAIDIESGYSKNPYHNRIHVCAVLHRMHIMLLEGGLGVYLKDYSGLYILAVYMAAMCHDYKHQGLTNDFLIKSHDNLATFYNDHAPNENYHLSQAFYVLKDATTDILSPLPIEAYHFVRNIIIELVLATDMSKHFEIINAFKNKIIDLPEHQSLQKNDSTTLPASTDKLLALKMAIKCADLSHTAAPWNEHKKWVILLQEELWNQGERENSLGLKTSILTDKNKKGLLSSQDGFFEMLAVPMYKAFVKGFPACYYLLEGCQRNHEKWRQEK